MIEVTNNYLDNNEFYKINKIIFGETFPWYFNHEKEFFHHLVKIDENNKRESSFFVTPVLSKLLVALKATNVIHSSISFCVKTNEIIEIPPLNELDKVIKMSVRLKNELNVDSRSYWKNTHKALSKISERLVKLATKVGSLK